jgi:hypothetical protein
VTDRKPATIVDLAPEQFRDLLKGKGYETASNLNQWHHDVVEAVVEAAVPDNRFGRVACPLCRSEGSPPPIGWAVPKGLTMHLEGGHRARPCPVVEAAFELMRDRLKQQKAASPKGR